MKKLIVTVVLTITTFSAFASCPMYSPYRCTQGYNGKMVCGCGV